MSASVRAVRPAAPLLGGQLGDDFLDDPYPTYHALREAGPIHWSEAFFGGAWILPRYEDVEPLLRDSRFSARRTGGWVMGVDGGAGPEELRPFQQVFARALLFLDGSDHLRLRRVMHAGFHADTLQRLVPYIDSQVGELIDSVEFDSLFDFIDRIARPLPSRVTAALMGLDPRQDSCLLHSWSQTISAFIGSPQPTLEQARHAQISVLEMCRCFRDRLAGGKVTKESMLGRLVQARSDGDVLDATELLAQCVMLLFAGHETTCNLLGNAMFHLASRSELWQQLRSEPHLIPSAIRELARYDSPVQYTGRRVTTDLEWHGKGLRKGDLVIGLIGAANRDPRHFEQPDLIDFTRQARSSLSFGSGPHVCIGAALAMLEAKSVLSQVTRKWPKLHLQDTAPKWSRNAVYRGLRNLTVQVTTGCKQRELQPAAN